MTGRTDTFAFRVGQDDVERKQALARDALRGLTSDPKDLPPKWFYDERGSALFEAITELPEYYPTRAEREILAERASEIGALAGADTLVELGSGSAVKTRLLLDALVPTGTSAFVPFDVCEEAVVDSSSAIGAEYPGLAIEGVVGDFQAHLDLIPRRGRTLVAFLGGTIGNLVPAERALFLAGIRSILERGEFLLLGADLVKDRETLLRAYDDASGLTAEFNRNVLRVLNHELDANFVPDQFDHVAVWDEGREWIEMRLRSRTDQVVELRAVAQQISFRAGEEMRTEVSAKFRREVLVAELATAGFDVVTDWTDSRGRFSLWMARAS